MDILTRLLACSSFISTRAALRYVTLHFYFDKTHCWIILLKKDDIYEQQSKIDSYGNFGMQGDMLQCDKENRALRQRSRERMTETRNRLLDVGKETDYTWAIPVKSRRRLSTNKKRRCIVYYDTPPSFFTPGSILGKTQRQESTAGRRSCLLYTSPSPRD